MATLNQVVFLILWYSWILLTNSTSISRQYRTQPVDELSYDDAYYNEPQNQKPAEYRFGYDVTSLDTGDIKSQHESRDGDSVQGYYSVMDPDGTLREVHYTADGYHGFRAVVKRFKHGILLN